MTTRSLTIEVKYTSGLYTIVHQENMLDDDEDNDKQTILRPHQYQGDDKIPVEMETGKVHTLYIVGSAPRGSTLTVNIPDVFPEPFPIKASSNRAIEDALSFYIA